MKQMPPRPRFSSRAARLGLAFALVAAAAFGGFAAIALQQSLGPAQASTPAPAPVAAALPAAIPGTPVPSLAPMLQRG